MELGTASSLKPETIRAGGVSGAAVTIFPVVCENPSKTCKHFRGAHAAADVVMLISSQRTV